MVHVFKLRNIEMHRMHVCWLNTTLFFFLFFSLSIYILKICLSIIIASHVYSDINFFKKNASLVSTCKINF